MCGPRGRRARGEGLSAGAGGACARESWSKGTEKLWDRGTLASPWSRDGGGAGLLPRSVLLGAPDAERGDRRERGRGSPGIPSVRKKRPRGEDDLRHGSQACVLGIPEVLPQTSKGGERDRATAVGDSRTEGTESGDGISFHAGLDLGGVWSGSGSVRPLPSSPSLGITTGCTLSPAL